MLNAFLVILTLVGLQIGFDTIGQRWKPAGKLIDGSPVVLVFARLCGVGRTHRRGVEGTISALDNPFILEPFGKRMKLGGLDAYTTSGLRRTQSRFFPYDTQ